MQYIRGILEIYLSSVIADTRYTLSILEVYFSIKIFCKGYQPLAGIKGALHKLYYYMIKIMYKDFKKWIKVTVDIFVNIKHV